MIGGQEISKSGLEQDTRAMPPDDQPDNEGGGAGGIIGIVFVVLLVAAAILLIERVKTSSAQTDCILTHDPRCRALTDK